MYQALYATSETLRQYIQSRLSGLSIPAPTLVAALETPREMGANDREGISVWLYRIERDPDRLNDAQERVGWNQLQEPPLPLRLHYLITPITGQNAGGIALGNSEAEQTLLGRVLQLFHTHPILRGADLQGVFIGTDTELHIRLESMSLEEITRVWEALEGSYQLSVSYEVSVVNIESDLQPEASVPVAVALPEYGTIVS